MHYYRPANFITFVGNTAFNFARDCYDIVGFTGELANAVVYAVTRPRKIRWKETFYYMDMCGTEALPIVLMLCFLMGVIMGFQAAIQMHKYGADILVADLVGFSIVKELGPLMVAMIAIGRAGSAFAAEIGTMKVSEELDAMKTMGFVPSRFLVIPKIIAMLVVIPILTVFGDFAGIVGGAMVGLIKLGLPLASYLDRTFTVIDPTTFSLGVAKSFVFAFLIAAVGCLRGFQAGSDAHGVGRSATSAVVSGIFLIVLADAVITVLYSFIGY